jgi:hypothetical protein
LVVGTSKCSIGLVFSWFLVLSKEHFAVVNAYGTYIMFMQTGKKGRRKKKKEGRKKKDEAYN